MAKRKIDIDYIEKKEKEYLKKLYINSLNINDNESFKKEVDLLIEKSTSFNELKEMINKKNIDLSSLYLSSFINNKKILRKKGNTTIKVIARPFYSEPLDDFPPYRIEFKDDYELIDKSLLEDKSFSIRFIF